MATTANGVHVEGPATVDPDVDLENLEGEEAIPAAGET